MILLIVGVAVDGQAAERIDMEQVTRQFGDWSVKCEKDVMMGTAKCDIMAYLSDGKGFIKVFPEQDFKIQITIPTASVETIVKLRVDRRALLSSKLIKKSDFGAVNFTQEQLDTLFSQFKYGNYLYIRFYEVDLNERGMYNEITERISLKGFLGLLDFYRTETGLAYAPNKQWIGVDNAIYMDEVTDTIIELSGARY